MKRYALRLFQCLLTVLLFVPMSQVCTGGVGWAQTLARMNVTTVGGGTPAAGGCSYSNQQSFTSATTGGPWGGDGADYLATAFTTTGAYDLCRIQMEMYRNGSCDGTIYLQVRTHSTDRPSSTVVGTSSTIDASTISTTATFYNFDFSPALSLSGSTIYWIVPVSNPACSQGQSMQINWATNGSQTTWYGTDGTSWTGIEGNSTFNYRTQN